jgi:hypothetical protein
MRHPLLRSHHPRPSGRLLPARRRALLERDVGADVQLRLDASEPLDADDALLPSALQLRRRPRPDGREHRWKRKLREARLRPGRLPHPPPRRRPERPAAGPLALGGGRRLRHRRGLGDLASFAGGVAYVLGLEPLDVPVRPSRGFLPPPGTPPDHAVAVPILLVGPPGASPQPGSPLLVTGPAATAALAGLAGLVATRRRTRGRPR